MDVCVMEWNAFVKSIVAIHILIQHSWHIWSIILYVARWSVVWYELLNPAWSSACSWSSRGFCTVLSRTVCTTLAMSISGGSYLHFPHHSPFLCNTFIFTFFHASGVNSFCLKIWLKICLTISFVSSSQAVMSSARIPSLSGDLPFLSFLIASCNSSVVI